LHTISGSRPSICLMGTPGWSVDAEFDPLLCVQVHFSLGPATKV
jgi:hypothetical protein